MVVAHALDALGLEFGAGQCGEQQRSEDRDNGDDYQQLDQRETSSPNISYQARNANTPERRHLAGLRSPIGLSRQHAGAPASIV
jgi:hypothetical protein